MFSNLCVCDSIYYILEGSEFEPLQTRERENFELLTEETNISQKTLLGQ